MRIKIDISVLGETNWRDYAVRFFFGGLITVITGLIAKKFGAGIGGLFLAFPAIFPASATLIEKNEKRKKQKQGLAGKKRGAAAASIDAAGAAIGSIGLLLFAFILWKYIATYNSSIVLAAATVIWLAASILIWEIRKAV